MKRWHAALASAVLLVMGFQGRPAVAQVHVIPTPIIIKADPQMVYPNSPGWLDSFGRIVIRLTGENLAPDDGYEGEHPVGQEGGYQHVFVRGMSPHLDKATAWVPASADNGCLIMGGMWRTGIMLGVDPRVFLSEPGSHLQVKLWVSFTVTGASDPAQSTALHSGWSAIKTIDVAPAGTTKPVPPPPAKVISTITRTSPSGFTVLDPPAKYRIKIYGYHVYGDNKFVIFNGDKGNPVPAEDRGNTADEDGTYLPAGETVFHVTIPERYRLTKPGQITVAVDNGDGIGPSRILSVSAVVLNPSARPAMPHPMTDLKAGMPALVPSATSNPRVALPPSITRLSVSTFVLGDRQTSYRIRIYGRNLCASDNKVLFNGDPASAMAPEDACKTADDDGTRLKDGEALVHVTIPERLRKPGQVTLTLVNALGRSEPVTITMKAGQDLPMLKPTSPLAPLTPKAPAPPPVEVKRK